MPKHMKFLFKIFSDSIDATARMTASKIPSYDLVIPSIQVASFSTNPYRSVKTDRREDRWDNLESNLGEDNNNDVPIRARSLRGERENRYSSEGVEGKLTRNRNSHQSLYNRDSQRNRIDFDDSGPSLLHKLKFDDEKTSRNEESPRTQSSTQQRGEKMYNQSESSLSREKSYMDTQSSTSNVSVTDSKRHFERENDNNSNADFLSPSPEYDDNTDPNQSNNSSVQDSIPPDADEIFKKMKETGLIPNAVAMLDGLCKDGLVQEAMKLFGLMREKGTIPEVVIYTAVVEGFCKAMRFDDAKRIFRKMQKNNISPNAFTYTVLIQGLLKGRKYEDSVDICIEMLECGHYPNVATFVTLIDGICGVEGLEEAVKIVRSLNEKGFAVDEKAVREYMEKKGPYSPKVWEAIFGKKSSHRLF